MEKFALTIFFSIALCCTAAEAQQIKTIVATLDNGLKVIMLENHKSPVATFQVWYPYNET